MKVKIFTAALSAVIITGCASGPQMGNVIPKSGGVYQAISDGSTKQEALESALFSAESTCKARNMRHVVSGEQTKYKGVVSEETNNVVNSAQGIITAVTGQWVPTLSKDDDYQVTLTFSCE